MKSLYRILLLSLLLVFRPCHAAQIEISSIPVTPYKVDDYIRAAVALQAMGREAACEALLTSAKTNASFDTRYYVLCRMLFTNRGTNEFQPPYSGHFAYMLGTESDWPLHPIALIDGIPFWLTGGGGFNGGGGGRQPVESYLRYCMTNCDWNTYVFHEVTTKQKNDALAKLLSLQKEQKTVTDFQSHFFIMQIE